MKKIWQVLKNWWNRPLTQEEIEEDKRHEELRDWMYWAW